VHYLGSRYQSVTGIKVLMTGAKELILAKNDSNLLNRYVGWNDPGFLSLRLMMNSIARLL